MVNKGKLGVGNRTVITVNLSLDKADFVMAAELIENLKKDKGMDLDFEDLFHYLLRYDFVEMEIYKKIKGSEVQK